jgi:hypothetical protein
VNVSDVEFTAGLGGFLVLFGLALVVWFLGRDLSRRLRRMRHREAQRQAESDRAEAADKQTPGARLAEGQAPGNQTPTSQTPGEQADEPPTGTGVRPPQE